MISRAELIYKLYPQAVRTVGEDAFDAEGNQVAIDQSLVDAEVAKTEYQRQRATAYPSIADQLDTLYHGGYDAWKATITAVKEEFPKP
jgi:hypothetical protein